MLEWMDLRTDPPRGDEHSVILFPHRSESGPLYIVIDTFYAKTTALEDGYTHWARFNTAPTHAKWLRWQDAERQKKSW